MSQMEVSELVAYFKQLPPHLNLFVGRLPNGGAWRVYVTEQRSLVGYALIGDNTNQSLEAALEHTRNQVMEMGLAILEPRVLGPAVLAPELSPFQQELKHDKKLSRTRGKPKAYINLSLDDLLGGL